MDETRTASHPLGASTDQTLWTVTIAAGARVGARKQLRRGESLTLGRGSDALGEGALLDRRLSRSHLRIDVDARGRAHLHDLDSRNGTFVNGMRVQALGLQSPQVVALGHIALVIDRQAPSPTRPIPPALREAVVGASSIFCECLLSLSDAMARRGPILLVGEVGVGKSALAEAALERLRPERPRLRIDCDRLEANGLASRLEAATPGATVLLEQIEQLRPEHHDVLAALLTTDAAPHELVATSRLGLGALLDAGVLPPALLHRLGRWPIVLPPLTQRPSDLGLLAAAFVERNLGRPRPLDPALVLRLLAGRWPGNLHSLEALIERCVAAADDDPEVPIRLAPGTSAVLDYEPCETTTASADDRATLLVHARGEWFRVREGRVASLRRRSPAARTLAVLARHAVATPEAVLDADVLVETVWPDEPMIGRSGRNRLYVALTALRKAGLADVIERRGQGYLLAGVRVEVLDDDSPPPG